MRINHDVLKHITPQMLAWWFANIGGHMQLDGQVLNRYHAWHPQDHILWELVEPGADGAASVGARFHIVEALGRNPDFYIDVIDTVTRLDASGFTAVSFMAGQQVSHLNHDFKAVDGGTLYVSSLTIGTTLPAVRSVLNPLIHRTMFTEAMGRAWLKHNVEEVGLLEHIIPLIYRADKQSMLQPAEALLS